MRISRSSRIAVYVIRTYGDVGGPPSRGGPIPIGRKKEDTEMKRYLMSCLVVLALAVATQAQSLTATIDINE